MFGWVSRIVHAPPKEGLSDEARKELTRIDHHSRLVLARSVRMRIRVMREAQNH